MVNKNNEMLFKFGTFAFLFVIIYTEREGDKKNKFKTLLRFPLFQIYIAIIKKEEMSNLISLQ